MSFGIFYDALDVCIKRYNLAKGTTYTKQDFVFDKPIDLRNWPTPHPSKKNTLVVATAGSVKIEFVYDRVDIQASYFKTGISNQFYRYLWKTCVGTKDTLAPWLQSHFGIPLEQKDIVPELFEPAKFTPAANRDVSITISDQSYNFLPGSTFKIGIGGQYVVVDGKTMLVSTPPTLTGPSQWTEDYAFQSQSLASRGHPIGLTWGIDYTPVARLLKRFSGWHVWYDFNCWGYHAQSGRSAAHLSDLCKALTSVDGLPWTFDGSSVPWTPSTHKPYNLYKAWGVYIGPTKGAIKEKAMQYRVPAQFIPLLDGCNPAFDNVLVVYFQTASNLVFPCAFFHFNNPKS